MTFAANAGTVPFNVLSYNFALDGGGGGATATLNGAPVEIYCDDFNNEINSPSNNSAYVTTLSTTANLIDTRFGEVASNAWTNLTSLGSTDDTFFNTGAGSTAWRAMKWWRTWCPSTTGPGQQHREQSNPGSYLDHHGPRGGRSWSSIRLA